jgi:acetate kinase
MSARLRTGALTVVVLLLASCAAGPNELAAEGADPAGFIDPAVVAHLRRVADLSAEDVDGQLNRASGLLGLAGVNDMREVRRRVEAGDDDAQLALDVYCYRIRKYVGAYFAVLARDHGIVSTAGVGENSPDVRARSLQGLECLDIEIDPVRNAATEHAARIVSTDDAAVAVLVVPTNEELEIARQSLAVVAAGGGRRPTI